MRVTKILTLATAALVMSASAASAVPTSTTDIVPNVSSVMLPSSFVISAVQDPQPPKAEVKVDISDDRTVWYTDPVWLAVGAIAALVVIVLAVMAARGGGRDSTTVVR